MEVHLSDDHVLIVLVWLKTNGTVGFYVLPDYNKSKRVFIDTGSKPVSILLLLNPQAC